jgi:hypothetical protein
MRARYIVPVGGLCAVAPIVYLLLPRVVERPDGIGEFSDWRPTQQEIAKSVGAGPAGTYTDARHVQFARMFQKRFRGHEIAVAIRFSGDDRLRVSCAAVIPRWDMAAVAAAAHQESKELFGRGITVDVYETYISLRPRKLGELSEDPQTGRLLMHFDPKYAAEDAAVQLWLRFPPPAYFCPELYTSGAFWTGPFRQQASRRRPRPSGFVGSRGVAEAAVPAAGVGRGPL